ncbi:hypothetical protein [Nocardioides sp. YIM 152315]|uniref:hypothetical protein n=1 Tax=Nocardioides sp. YIM 152315 TaxID=3031760 RepID=UPI0023DA74D3|nr:hypothetical protein [Nocardioides sp. YIM 152315]MDF1603461.1 hypothetical protein [Nocardioides sp. YIM 152315]
MRSASEILASLDESGDLEHLPFMPEMLPLLGSSFTVSARADKTCDTVNITGCSREMDDTVHLTEVRCDGSAHGGCQAGCLLFFKEEWLSRDDAAPQQPAADEAAALAELTARVEARTTVAPGVYRCQATALPDATRPMSGMRHYLRDVQTRNVSPRLFLRAMRIAFVDRYQRFSRRRLPGWARVQGGAELPDVRGTLKRTPVESLDLQPGEIVEVRSLPEIVATLDTNQRNRNLWFDREMIRYCGRRFRVLRRVDRLIDEKTGEMIQTRTPSLVLDGAVCVGDYHKLCPRQDYAFFREIWVKRPEGAAPAVAAAAAGATDDKTEHADSNGVTA